MIEIGNVIVTIDLFKECFMCELSHCKGICCVEGDAGAPVEEEVEQLKEVLPIVWNDLSESAKELINREGVVYSDVDGDLVTSIVNGKDCVFTCYDENGICYCAIEKAYREGKTSFYKPISCHLYPIRIQRSGSYELINYHRWPICQGAVKKGRQKKIPLYQFLKEPLIRKYGEAWYDELLEIEGELKKQGII
ncbi:MAG: DUF3109 family protein [Bacteroidales bacterium]|nr:DUF3109 family protein [Bacteroidales bacterium]